MDLEAPTDTQGRLFILAVDNGSFEAGTIPPAMEAAEQFVDSLEPNDRLGLYVYPSGPRIPPTVDRAPIRTALANRDRREMDAPQPLQSAAVGDRRHHGRARHGHSDPSEHFGSRSQRTAGAVAAYAVPVPADWDAVLRVVRRECPGEVDCPSHILNEVASLAPHLENQADMSLGVSTNCFARSLAFRDERPSCS